MESTESRPLRADAVRNRAKVLEAARQQIAAHGPEIGMDEIAAEAGVAVGTLYRHFPTKTHLVGAVVGEYVSQVADRAEEAVARSDGGSPALGELIDLFHDIVLATANNHAAKAAADALHAALNDSVDVQRAAVSLQTLIDRAKAEHGVRPDLSLDDFSLLINNVPGGQSAASLERWVDLVLHGLAGDTPPR